jgi:hypothetical protein
MLKFYNLIMDFIKNHRGLLTGAAAVAASIAIALYLQSHSGITDQTRETRKCLYLRFMNQNWSRSRVASRPKSNRSGPE